MAGIVYVGLSHGDTCVSTKTRRVAELKFAFVGLTPITLKAITAFRGVLLGNNTPLINRIALKEGTVKVSPDILMLGLSEITPASPVITPIVGAEFTTISAIPKNVGELIAIMKQMLDHPDTAPKTPGPGGLVLAGSFMAPQIAGQRGISAWLEVGGEKQDQLGLVLSINRLLGSSHDYINVVIPLPTLKVCDMLPE